MTAPLTADIAHAVARLHDDQGSPRKPSHGDLSAAVKRAGLAAVDPAQGAAVPGQTQGKHRRLREVLLWALEHDPAKGERLVGGLVAQLRSLGGFSESSPNYCGRDAIENARAAFKRSGYLLASDGDLRAIVLENLAGKELSAALRQYIARAQRGVADAALLAGTAKDLMEATAGHVVLELEGSPSSARNFPMLLVHAYQALGLATSQKNGQQPREQFDAALFQVAQAVNAMRNRDGTGHGRPWLPEVTEEEARLAVQAIGVVADHLLVRLDGARKQRARARV
jgi:hypothetical protein